MIDQIRNRLKFSHLNKNRFKFSSKGLGDYRTRSISWRTCPSLLLLDKESSTHRKWRTVLRIGSSLISKILTVVVNDWIVLGLRRTTQCLIARYPRSLWATWLTTLYRVMTCKVRAHLLLRVLTLLAIWSSWKINRRYRTPWSPRKSSGPLLESIWKRCHLSN